METLGLSYTMNILALLTLHFVGDFLLQWDRMADTKGTNRVMMLCHGFCYILPFVYFFSLPWLLLNCVLHILVDSATSKGTRWAFTTQGMHNRFFNMVGLDQLIHFICLIVTFHWIEV